MRLFSLLALTLTACATGARQRADANPHSAEPIGTVREMYDGRLTPVLAAQTFRNIDRLFPSRRVARGDAVSPLPELPNRLNQPSCTVGDTVHSLDEYFAQNRVTALLVLKRGQIALERYAAGNTAETRWMSMSMAKSVTSTLIGIALREGKIRSLNDDVTDYVPSLRGSAYQGVTIRHMLMMSSGVRWNETYTDSSSDRRHLLEAQLGQRAGAPMALMATLPRAAKPGSVLNYSTGETLVAGAVVRGAVGTSLSTYLSERLWKPLGMQSDATWWLDAPEGQEIAGSGLSATLRDFGRFGLFIMHDGIIDGKQLLPDGWVTEAGSSKTLSSGVRSQYGYMWWPVDAVAGSINDGAFTAQGIFGQWIYVNRREQVVIVQWSAQTQPSGGDRINPELCFAAMADSLRHR